ncbi:MAG: UDP-N-acetylmuramate dehydrogenase [Candidatus Symbiobacter sp.]|nr:UDP-N-acetylmuramate dehydrogenase [Candidatus Symbiobacter sp.]
MGAWLAATIGGVTGGFAGKFNGKPNPIGGGGMMIDLALIPDQPKAALSGATSPDTAHPNLVRPDTAHPNLVRPDTAHPDMAHPDLAWRDALLAAAAAAAQQLRGRLTADAALATTSWFGVGGTADLLFRPVDREDLQLFLQLLPPQVPLTILGATSNVLLRDGGIRGAVIRLGRDFAKIDVAADDATAIQAGAAALDVAVAGFAAGLGLTGLAFLIGIPGSVGGAVAMNAGAFGGETKDFLSSVVLMDRQGHISTASPQSLNMSYRQAELPAGHIVIAATFQAQIGDEATIRERMKQIKQERDQSQPTRSKTGGSTFKNPPAAATAHLPPNLKKAWQLIDAAGCRGLRRGAAMVSDKHCNFLVNLGGSTAREIEQLGEDVRQSVLEKFALTLEWEIKRLGEVAMPVTTDQPVTTGQPVTIGQRGI